MIPHAAEHDALFHARGCLSAPRAALAQAGDPFGAGGTGRLCDPALPAPARADYASASTVQPLYSYSELLMTVGLFYLTRYLCRSYEDGPRMQYLSKCTLRIYVNSALWISAYPVLHPA